MSLLSKSYKNICCFDINTIIELCHNFAHATTAQLSWHVQNCEMIWIIRIIITTIRYRYFSQDSIYELTNALWWDPGGIALPYRSGSCSSLGINVEPSSDPLIVASKDSDMPWETIGDSGNGIISGVILWSVASHQPGYIQMRCKQTHRFWFRFVPGYLPVLFEEIFTKCK